MSKARRIAELLSDRVNKNGGTLSNKDFDNVTKQIKSEYKPPISDMVPGVNNLYESDRPNPRP